MMNQVHINSNYNVINSLVLCSDEGCSICQFVFCFFLKKKCSNICSLFVCFENKCSESSIYFASLIKFMTPGKYDMYFFSYIYHLWRNCSSGVTTYVITHVKYLMSFQIANHSNIFTIKSVIQLRYSTKKINENLTEKTLLIGDTQCKIVLS